MLTFIKLSKQNSTIISISIIVLIISILVYSIGHVAYFSAHDIYNDINDQYTTIGIHSGLNYEKFHDAGSSIPTGLDSTCFSDGSVYIGPYDAMECAKESSYYISSSNSLLLSAHINNSTSLTSGSISILDYNVSYDSHCYNLAVLAIEILSVKEKEDPFLWKEYTIEARILDNVCIMNAYDLPPENDIIYIDTSLYAKDGTIPFETGKSYLVRGRYWDYTITDLGYLPTTDGEGNTYYEYIRGRDIESGRRKLLLEGNGPLVDDMSTLGRNTGVQNFIYDIHEDPESGLLYFTTPSADCWPYYVEFDGDWKQFLETDAGYVWKNSVIPNFEINHASSPVILTNNIDSLYLFNTGDASILEGREIAHTEYENGDAVCLVSASYAKMNHLTVGDTISLDYYNSGYDLDYCVISSNNSHTSLTIERYPLTPSTHMGIKLDYTIVGLYTAPEWTPGTHNFHADTIFVPKASVPGSEQIKTKLDVRYNGSTIPMLNSIVIDNGKIEQFEKYMSENNMAGVYLYFDQGYSEAAASVEMLIQNAQRIMIVGISMFVLSSLLFILLYIRRTVPVIRTMRLLGVSAKKTWLESFTSLIWQVVIAVLIGNSLAVILYDRITQMVLSVSLELSYGSVALCGAVQFLVLFVAGMIWTRSVANRNLMQKR